MIYILNENTILLKKKLQVIMPITMLEYLLIQNSFVSDIYMDSITDNKFELLRLIWKNI